MSPARPSQPDAHEADAFGMVLGQVIVRLREQRAMTQADLAAKLGISQSAVSKLEAGRRPDAFVYGQLARVFGLEVQQLDAQVHEAMRRTREAVAAVNRSKAGLPWGEILALAGFVGIIGFVVAAVLGDDDDGQPPKRPGKTPR